MDKNVKEEMSFLDHLEDLRWHLIRSVFAVLITGSIAFIAKDFIFGRPHEELPSHSDILSGDAPTAHPQIGPCHA